jgi:CRISPR-associated protein Csm3
MGQGAKIVVDDALVVPELSVHAVSAPLTQEQPHFSAGVGGPQRGGRSGGLFRSEETVAAGTRFRFHIRLDNANEDEVGLVLLALQEFNEKRLQIGGATSRGLGFVTVREVSVKRRMLSSDGLLSEIPEKNSGLVLAGKKFLKSIDCGRDSGKVDFSVYASAHAAVPTTGMPDGFVVVPYVITVEKPFRMAGFEEPTVTSRGVPYIPGSTIKGFLRHQFGRAKERQDAGSVQLFSGGRDYPPQRREASREEELFGDPRNHRSRVLVADAFCSDTVKDTDAIPVGTQLLTWIVFDNMNRKEIEEVCALVDKPVTITGSRSAGINRRAGVTTPTHNVVEFTPQTQGIRVFRTSSYVK